MTSINPTQTKSILMLNSVKTIFQEVKASRSNIVASTIDHFVLHHKARSTVFDKVTSFILKSRDGIDAVDYMIGLVMDNFASANNLVDLIKDDGAVETEFDTWGCLDLNDPNNIDVQSLFDSLISTLKTSKSNPKNNVQTEGANLGVLSFAIEKKEKMISRSTLFNVQRMWVKK